MKRGKKLDDTTVTKVPECYENDEYCRICPGKKDYVSVKLSSGVKQHEQKKLLLMNLKDMYLDFGKITRWVFNILCTLSEILHNCWKQWHTFCLCLRATSECKTTSGSSSCSNRLQGVAGCDGVPCYRETVHVT